MNKKLHEKSAEEDSPLRNITDEKKIGPYILIKKIGAGGMGIVYKAYHPGLDKYFAVKTISIDAKDEEIKRFVREARLAAKLRHPNIVTVHDVGEDKGQHYIVMDYIQGKELRDIVANERLCPRACLEIVRDIAKALDTAHKEGIIHRDIKPSNILIAEPERTPFLTDFGLAASVKKEIGLTRSGQVLGTPKYMSPEQAMGKARHLDCRSDIYSLGVVLYEMLRGRPLVRGDNLLNILYQVVSEDPAPLSKHIRIAQDVEAIAMKCLEKDPSRRYQNAGEMADDIERYLNGEPVLARPSGIGYRLRKWIRRNKSISIIITLAVFVIFTGNLWYIRELRQERNKTEYALQIAEAEKENFKHARKQAEDALKRYLESDKSRKEAQDIKKKQETAVQIIDEAVQWANEKRPLALVVNKLKEAEDEAPFYPGLYRAWGKVYYEYGIRENVREVRNKLLHQGLEMLEKAISISDDDYLSWFYKHFIFRSLGDNKNADKCIWKVASLNPDNEYGAFGEGTKLMTESEKTTSLEDKRRLKKKALAAFIKSIKYNNKFAWAYLNRGTIYSDMKMYEEALADYSKAITLDPTFTTVYINRGTLYSDMKRYEESFADCNKAISLDPTLAIVYNNRGTLYYDKNNYEESLADYNKAIFLDPTLATAYINRGNLYCDKNKYEEAFADYNKAITLDPVPATAYDKRGTLYKKMKRYEESLADYNRAITLDPNYVQAYNNRALLYHGMDRYEESLADYNKAITLNPDYSITYINRGNLYYDKNKYEEALGDYSKAISLDPTFATTYSNRGALYHVMNRYTEAMTDYNIAIRYDSRLGRAYANRGKLYYAMHQYSKAIEDFEHCKQLGAGDTTVEQCLKECKEAMNKKR